MRRQWHPTPVGKSHGWRSLVGYSPWGHEESDMTEQLHFHFPALEKAMAPQSSTLAWKIPWMEEPGGLQSMGSLGVGHDWVTSLSLFTFMHWRRQWQPTPVFLPGESQGRRSLVDCRLWGHTESDRTEAMQQQQLQRGMEGSIRFFNANCNGYSVCRATELAGNSLGTGWKVAAFSGGFCFTQTKKFR